MEKYVKLSDVKEVIKKLVREPRYQHEDEDFYSGVCAVDCEVSELQVTYMESPPTAIWVSAHKGFMDNDYRCSNCGTWADEGNSGHYSVLTEFCKGCGHKMIIKED